MPFPPRDGTGERQLLVVGDALLDRDLIGTVERLSPEAPGPRRRHSARAPKPGRCRCRPGSTSPSLLSGIGATFMNLTGVTDLGNGSLVLAYAPAK